MSALPPEADIRRPETTLWGARHLGIEVDDALAIAEQVDV
jgi:hypothetical protein